MAKKSILILNGPGLADSNAFAGYPDSELSLRRIESKCSALCNNLGVNLSFRHSDNEQEIFRAIDSDTYDGLIINPASHARAASVDFELFHHAIRLIAPLKKPLIEVHVSNIFLPGSAIKRPLLVPEADIGFIAGLAANGYLLALKALTKRLQREKKS